METKRLNLTVDPRAADILERMAGGRNKMGDYLSKLLISMESGTPTDEIERMDRESLRSMVQGLLGRVVILEGEFLRVQAQMAAIIAEKAQ